MTQRRHILLVSAFLLALFSLADAFAQNAAADGSVFSLTTDEQRWLAEHPVIRIAPDPSFAPIEWFNQQGVYNGITADYVALLEQKLGVQFEVVRGENWSNILAMVRAREVDALTAIIRTTQREQYLAFSKPYFFSTRAIFSNQNLNNIETVEDLKGYKVAVVKGSWMDEKLSQLTGMSLNRFQDLSTALIATSRGVTDLTASALESTRYIRSREGLLDLAIVSELPEQIELSIGVRNDWRPLVGILDKALASISTEETAAIRAKWLELEEPYFWEKPVYRYTALAMVAMLITSLIIILTWNRMLNARVQRRGAQLEAAQMQLMRAEKMESIGRLSAGIAHEVKNPLAIIQMGIDYLGKAIPMDESTKEVVADIDNAVQRADTVIKGLLDFSHTDKLELTAGNMHELIEESLRLVKHEMTIRQINVSTELAAVNPVIDLDANKIKQVFINLLMNAAHAINRDGHINVSCSETKRGAADAVNDDFPAGEPVLRIRISDDGPGISKENLKKLFDPFFTTKPVGEGTGLGLSVSRKIIQLHHGTMDISNTVDGGAMVTLDLKMTMEAQA
jgi:signal transduction histidine kinase